MTSSTSFPSTYAGIRWFGDIHGAHAVQAAAEQALARGYAIGFIGDLTDADPADEEPDNDSAAVLRLLARLDAQGRAVLVPGNHCFKLLRYLVKWRAGDGAERRMELTHGLDRTLAEIRRAPDRDALVASTIRILSAAPLWRNIGPWLFVHAGASSAMFDHPAPTAGEALSLKGDGRVHRALFGQTDGTRDSSGYPVRLYDWLESIPNGRRVVIGHDRCEAIFTQTNALGGKLVRIDTGAGKGGTLSWLDIPAGELQGCT
ncbi:metallophosphoesterase [Novosphingobium decolorationis]|uniref:metallophosphoesterase n=1 Tax=Novosphingobium decolorationis TaxID=2698673 RepID=UPI0030D6023C